MNQRKDRGVYRGLTAYGDAEFSRYMRRAFLASSGYDEVDLTRPIVGIVDTSSDYNNCHRQMPELIAAVKRGVLEGGGLPFAFPTISLNEILTHPTTMLYRNLAAMETEEMIRAQPMDAVVLVGGCDKTIPAQLMAAASANVPAICLVTGPMLAGHWRGERLGACTDCRSYWARFRADEINEEEIGEVERSLCATAGTCMVMGTAASMACVAEALGMMLPGGSTPPSGSGNRLRHAVATGRRAAELAQSPVRPREVLTAPAFRNALTVLSSVGGSTNVVIHLLAIARRAGVSLSLEDFDEVSRSVPLLVDLKPAGRGYAEDFHRAGGLPPLLKTLAPVLELSTVGVTGKPLSDLIEDTAPPGTWQSTIRRLDDPLGEAGSLVTLRGSLAPEGAVIKKAAASPALLRHRGPALVFESPEDVAERIDNPDLEITPEHVLILRNAGPVAAGMPEAGAIPIPRSLARAGVRDMVRISDARMSGTAYGTIVLHCAPESAVGGPLAFVRDGDTVELDVAARRIDLIVEDSTLAQRRAEWSPSPLPERGWHRLYSQHVLQASEGADLDFLLPTGVRPQAR